MKLTAKDLIAKQLEKSQKKPPITVFVPSLGGELTFEAPDREAIIDLLDGATDVATGGGMKAMYDAFKKTMYMLCDTLRDPELHEAYGVKDPLEIVDKLFEPQEVISMGELLTDSNKPVKKVDEAIKNS